MEIYFILKNCYISGVKFNKNRFLVKYGKELNEDFSEIIEY